MHHRVLPNTNWKHEEASIMMFKDLVAETPDLNFDADEMMFLCELIHPSAYGMSQKHRFSKKAYLYDVVSAVLQSCGRVLSGPQHSTHGMLGLCLCAVRWPTAETVSMWISSII